MKIKSFTTLWSVSHTTNHHGGSIVFTLNKTTSKFILSTQIFPLDLISDLNDLAHLHCKPNSKQHTCKSMNFILSISYKTSHQQDSFIKEWGMWICKALWILIQKCDIGRMLKAIYLNINIALDPKNKWGIWSMNYGSI